MIALNHEKKDGDPLAIVSMRVCALVIDEQMPFDGIFEHPGMNHSTIGSAAPIRIRLLLISYPTKLPIL